MTTRRSMLMAVTTLPACAGCATESLWPKPPPLPALYALESDPIPVPAAPSVAQPQRPSIVVATPRAAPGYDGNQIVYQRRAQQIEHFAFARWVDTPAQMLAPLVVATLQRSGSFSVVVSASAATAAELRLDIELIRLLHDFTVEPSRVRLTLRATLIDAPRRRVLATREFDVSETATSDDPYGGVVAAQRAVVRALAELATFCSAAV